MNISLTILILRGVLRGLFVLFVIASSCLFIILILELLKYFAIIDTSIFFTIGD